VTAVGAGHVHDQPEFSSRMVHILPLELFQLGLICPSKSFVGIDGAIEGS